jgi:hypothetical protein
MKVKALVLALIIGATGAYAGGNNNTGGDSCRGNCPSGGGQSSSSSTLVQGQAQGQAQQQGQQQQAVANSSGGSGGQGGSVVIEAGAFPQQAARPNNTSIETGGVSVSEGDTNFSSETEINYPASSAATVYADVCQSGASGQVEDGGFSIVKSDEFCNLIKLADVMQRAAVDAERKGQFKQSEIYWARHREALDDANSLIQSTQYTGWIGHVANQIGLPIALIAALVLLI